MVPCRSAGPPHDTVLRGYKTAAHVFQCAVHAPVIPPRPDHYKADQKPSPRVRSAMFHRSIAVQTVQHSREPGDTRPLQNGKHPPPLLPGLPHILPPANLASTRGISQTHLE